MSELERRPRDMSRFPERLKPLDVLSLALIVLAPLPIGGMWPLGKVITAAAAMALLFASCIMKRGWRWSPITLIFVGLAAWTLLRAAPGSGMLALAHTSAAYDLWPDATARASIAPGRAALAAWHLLGLAAVVQLWVVRFSAREHVARTAKAVGAAALLVVGVGGVQFLGGFDSILGLYSPTQAPGIVSQLAGPFVNPNQAGALIALGAGTVFVALWNVQDVSAKAVGLAIVLGASAYLFEGLSAFAALAGLLACCGIMIVVAVVESRWHLRRIVWPAYIAMLLGITGLSVVTYTSLNAVSIGGGALVRKSEVWRNAMSLAFDAKLVGFGPGSFADIYPAVQSTIYQERYAYVEAYPLQALIDHGWIACAIAVGVFIWTFAYWFKSRGSGDRPLQLGFIAVGSLIAVEAIAGMGLASTGYGVPVAALLGICAARIARIRDKEAPASRGSRLVGVLAFVLVGAAATPTLIQSTNLGTSDPYDAVQAIVVDSESTAASFDGLSQAIPASTVVITAAATVALRDGDLGRASTLVDYLTTYAPTRANTHRIQFLFAMVSEDSDGACAAISRLAADRGTQRSELVRFLMMYSEDPRDWRQCIPAGEVSDQQDPLLASLLADGRFPDALAAANRVLRSNATNVPALRTATRACMEMDLDEQALFYAEILVDVAPDDPDNYHLLVDILRTLDHMDRALTALQDGTDLHPRNATLLFDRIELLLILARAGTANPGWDTHVELDLQTTDELTRGDDRLRARRLLLAASFYEHQERWRDLARVLEVRNRLQPENVRILLDLARVAEVQNRTVSAARYYREVLAIEPENQRARDALNEIR